MNAESIELEGCLNDAGWLTRVREGDEDAARALVKRLYPTVVKSIRCHLPRRSSEEDLAQVVFARIFAKLHQFSGMVPLEHWVSRIAVNACLSQLSRERVRPELRMSDLTEEDERLVKRLLVTEGDLESDRKQEATELLEKLFTALTPDERLVVTLLHLEERTASEISEMTGWSVSRVKVKAFRARAKMRKLWTRLVKSLRQPSFERVAVYPGLRGARAAASPA
ncbi:MAG: RNA polymerase sigma factor [Verrucomicrobiia bacterium]